MGDRTAPIDSQRLVHRHRMRIRTIAVSFAAAVSSAHRDLVVGPAERDALIETWRIWSLEVLERYDREIQALRDAPDAPSEEELADLRSRLDDAIVAVREA